LACSHGGPQFNLHTLDYCFDKGEDRSNNTPAKVLGPAVCLKGVTSGIDVGAQDFQQIMTADKTFTLVNPWMTRHDCS